MALILLFFASVGNQKEAEMKIFMTGASGFIGSWVLKALLDAGHSITTMVRNPEKIPSLKNLNKVNVVQGDMQNLDSIKAAMPGHDACIHIALGWGETPLEMLEKDTRVTLSLLEEADSLGYKHFLFTSSTAALGEVREFMTTWAQNRPIDLYGATKAAAEAYILGFATGTSMQCNVIRPGYTFGNPAFPDGVTQPDQRFSEIVLNAKEDIDIELIQYDGTQFIWAGDLAKIYLKVLDCDKTRMIFHGLSQEFVSWERIAQETIEMANSKSKIILKDKGWGKTPSLFDVNAIKNEFGLSFYAHKHITEHIQYLIENKNV